MGSVKQAKSEPVSPLRAERRRRGWSLTHVTVLSGIATADLSLVERGLRPAHPGWRRRLAVAFRLPETVLFPAEAPRA